MQDKKKYFETFSDARLIDIVKNANQFGYDDNIIRIALEILNERGISESDLKLTGNLTNSKFDYTQDLFHSYNSTSKFAFISYFVLLLLKAIDIFNLFGISEPGIFFSSLYWLILIIYFVSLTKSFLDHVAFYKSIDKELGTGDQIVFFILGMPFFIFMYFFYKSKMKEEMLMIK